MSSIVERACLAYELDQDLAVRVADTLERVGSVAEAVFCFKAFGLTQRDIAYLLGIPQTRVWLTLHRDLLGIQSLLQAGVVAA